MLLFLWEIMDYFYIKLLCNCLKDWLSQCMIYFTIYDYDNFQELIKIQLMASKYLQKYPVPAGFQEILADLTRQILRDQPSNIIQYAAKYFETLESGKKFQFDSKTNVRKEDKKYELSYNPKNAEDITKKASNIAVGIQHEPQYEEEGVDYKVGKEKQSAEEKKEVIFEEVAEQIFNQYDKDKNGYLDSKQILNFVKAIMPNLGYTGELPELDIELFVDELDKNGNGRVVKEELIPFVKKVIYHRE